MTPIEPTLLTAFGMLLAALVAYAAAMFMLVRADRPPGTHEAPKRRPRRPSRTGRDHERAGRWQSVPDATTL